MKNKYQHIIGIDPDVEKSGLALLDTETRKIEFSSFRFPELLDYLQKIKQVYIEQNQSLIVVVEAGWMNSISNYHYSKNARSGQRISKNVGANHEVGKIIIKMCQHYKIDVEAMKPLKKCWKGKDRKITHDEIQSFTGIKSTRSNQEERDAILLAWVYVGFPIRIIK